MDFTGKKAALHTLGCKVNIYETDAMRSALQEAGFEIVPFEETADVYVINTCSVTNIADRKSRQMISRARKRNPRSVVVAAGCYVQTALEKTGKKVDADILIGSGCKGKLVEELGRFYENENFLGSNTCISDVMHQAGYEALSLPAIEGHTRASIKVQDGCNMFCSYCIIPFARGRIRSRRMEDVMQEVSNLARQGVREVVLTGIHLSSYGVDFAGDVDSAYGEDGTKKTWQERSKLIDLIEQTARIDGIERVRLGSLEPTIITPEFVKRLSALKEICPHFHLSLQSGCDSVLKRMNRHYTAQQYAGCAALLREYFDNPALTTDVIAGFPGETQEEFDETVRFLENINLYETHLFRYSMRAGTKAALRTDQIPEKVKEERLSVLAALDRRMREKYERSRSGMDAEVLFEEEAHIDENGFISVPNSGALSVRVPDNVIECMKEKTLYTGYTKEYIRAFAFSKEELRGQIRKGKLKVETLALLEYT